MFTFTKTDEGFQVHTADGRGVATVDCGRVEFDHNPKFKEPEKVFAKWEPENWIIHFTGLRFKPPELTAFLDELSKQEF